MFLPKSKAGAYEKGLVVVMAHAIVQPRTVAIKEQIIGLDAILLSKKKRIDSMAIQTYWSILRTHRLHDLLQEYRSQRVNVLAKMLVSQFP